MPASPDQPATVFISYRRSDEAWAVALRKHLMQRGYDVFLDTRSIGSGRFPEEIEAQIAARSHFLLLLTPGALDRIDEPGDWLNREIGCALDHRRNIVPILLSGFRFDVPAVHTRLTGKLALLAEFNALNVPDAYFDEAMERLDNQYLKRGFAPAPTGGNALEKLSALQIAGLMLTAVCLQTAAAAVVISMRTVDYRIVLPMFAAIAVPFGYRIAHGLPSALLVDILLALAQAVGMLLITSIMNLFIHHSPVLPTNAEEWTIFVQWIACSAAGYLLGASAHRLRERSGLR